MKKLVMILFILFVCGALSHAAPFVHNYTTSGVSTPPGFTNSDLPIYYGEHLNNLQCGNEYPNVSSGETDGYNDNIPAETPEPATLILFGIGLAGLVMRKRLLK